MTNGQGIVRKAPVGRYGERGAIGHEWRAIPIEDAPTGGGRGHGARLVAHRELLVVVRRDHLHSPELGENRRKDGTHAGGKQGEARFKGNLRSIAFPFGGFGARSVNRIEGEAVRVVTQHDQRGHDGHNENQAGYNNDELGIHRQLNLMKGFLVPRAL